MIRLPLGALPHTALSRAALSLAAVSVTLAPATAQEPGGEQDPQDPVDERLDKLENENRELRQRLERVEAESQGREEGFEALAAEIQRLELRDVMPAIGEQRHGLGPAASKVYGIEQGLSIGGYGEILFTQRSGDLDRFDALRNVLYFGYKFDERFLLNTEIEMEHGSTSASSGSTDSSGSVSLEFGYLDYMHDEALNARAGVVLVPVGLINETHEPTTFLSANRPETERRIIPTTWRAPGVGVFGEKHGFEYRLYGLAALNGEEFDGGGLRGGRQKANRAAADDFALSGRLDWTETPGLLVGSSFYWGDTGQDGIDDAGNVIPELNTTLVDVHADWRPGDWRFRALYAHAWLDDAETFNTNTGAGLAERMQGFYGEIGYDVAPLLDPDSGQSLVPFVRYEEVDTQHAMPTGTVADSAQDETIWTFGASYQPIPEIVVKLDYEDRHRSADRFNVLFGWVF